MKTEGWLTDRTSLTATGSLQLIAAAVEALIAVWLLAHWRQRQAWRSAILLFTVLAAFAAGKTLHEASRPCGCFGRMDFPIWLALVIDIVALGLLLCARAAFWRNPQAHPPFALAADRKLAAASLSIALMATVSSTALPPRIARIVGGEVLLDPDRLVGRRLTFVNDTRLASKVSAGNWLVVLHRHGCEPCNEMLARLEAGLVSRDPKESRPRIALLEVPPFGGARYARRQPPHVLTGKLDDSRRWIVKTPLVLSVVDGVVRSYGSHL